jgi:glutaredoxin-like YruB-family protein
MADPKIIVFTQPDCPPCRSVKVYLADKGLEFEERDVTVDQEAVRELVETYQSRSTPTIVIGENVMIGFDPEELDQILAK